ncbi:MAG: hypothetical protein HKO65_06765 [Gemmatimonadetes bacterium]|nr:hypothetical protein [Gemmatimonadota bacterium]
MDWTMETDEARDIITFTIAGEWDAGEIIEAIEALWPEQIRTGILRVLWDMRGVDGGGVDTVEVREVANHHLTARPELPESRAAVVTSRDLEFGMARMTEAFITESPVDMQIFRDIQKAYEWLEEKG